MREITSKQRAERFGYNPNLQQCCVGSAQIQGGKVFQFYVNIQVPEQIDVTEYDCNGTCMVGRLTDLKNGYNTIADPEVNGAFIRVWKAHREGKKLEEKPPDWRGGLDFARMKPEHAMMMFDFIGTISELKHSDYPEYCRKLKAEYQKIEKA